MKIIKYFIPLFFFIGCNNPKIEKYYFIGNWKSSDGGYIILKKNGTCTLKNINYFKFSSFPENKDKILDTEGTWSFVDSVNNGIINGIDKGINISYKIPTKDGNGGITFYISGQGLNGNKEPWNLFIWDGDPDEMVKYEFIKE